MSDRSHVIARALRGFVFIIGSRLSVGGCGTTRRLMDANRHVPLASRSSTDSVRRETSGKNADALGRAVLQRPSSSVASWGETKNAQGVSPGHLRPSSHAVLV